MVEQVEQAAEQSQGDYFLRAAGSLQNQGQPEGHHDVADLADRTVGQQPLQVPLSQGQQSADDHAGHTEGHHRMAGHRRDRQDVEHQPGQHVDADGLDQDAAEHGADRGRGRGMSVGQPGVEGHHGRLQTEAHQEERSGQPRGLHPLHSGLVHRGQRLGDAGHVQVAGQVVENADAEQDKDARHAAQDQVLKRRFEFLFFGSEGHQGVAGDCRHLQEDVEVEQVAGHHHAVHSRDHQQEKGVVEARAREAPHVADAEQNRQQADQVDRQAQQLRKAVAHERDADRHALAGPASHPVGGPVDRDHLADGQQQQSHHDRQGQQLDDPAAADELADQGAEEAPAQWNRYHQWNQFFHDQPLSLRMAVMSNVPYFSCSLMANETTRATIPRPITMLVRISA